MKPIRALPVAQRELADAAAHYEEIDLVLSFDFLDEYGDAMTRVQDHPQAWAMVDAYRRRCQFHRFPYAIIYEEFDDEIVVLAVTHMRRHPDSWKGRA